MERSYERELVYLLLVAALVLAAGIGLRDPWPADEPRFALIARDMVDSGNWLIPLVGGVVYPDKPPLFFWIVAVFYSLTDSLKVAFLLPGFVAGLVTLWLTADLGRRLWGTTAGLWSAAALLATVQFPLQMKSGQIDGLLCLWTTLGLYGMCRHLLLGPDWPWYTLAGVAAGLGVMTKGVGFLPYLVLIPFGLARLRGWNTPELRAADWRWLLAPVASLLVVGAWLVPMLLASAGNPELAAYRDNLLFHQTITRYANSWGHIKPPWYFVTNVIPLLWLPAAAALPWLVPAWWRDLKQRDVATLLLGGWALLVVLFFSLSMGKRSLYIFPALPAVALLVGRHAGRLTERAGVQRVLVAFPVALGAALVAVAMYALMNPHTVDRWLVDTPTIVRSSLALLGLGLAMLVVVAVFRRERYRSGFAVSMVVFWLGLAVLVSPALNHSRSGLVITEAVAAQTDAAAPVAFVAWPEQFLLQWTRPVTHFGYRRPPDDEIADAVNWLRATPNGQLLLPATHARDCFDSTRLTPVGTAHRRDWLLARQDALIENCPATDDATLVVHYTPPEHRPSRRF